MLSQDWIREGLDGSQVYVNVIYYQAKHLIDIYIIPNGQLAPVPVRKPQTRDTDFLYNNYTIRSSPVLKVIHNTKLKPAGCRKIHAIILSSLRRLGAKVSL